MRSGVARDSVEACRSIPNLSGSPRELRPRPDRWCRGIPASILKFAEQITGWNDRRSQQHKRIETFITCTLTLALAFAAGSAASGMIKRSDWPSSLMVFFSAPEGWT